MVCPVIKLRIAGSVASVEQPIKRKAIHKKGYHCRILLLTI